MKLELRRHIYHDTSHGPLMWPWWKLLTISIVRCTHDPYRFLWITPITYNIWIYTRWGAMCHTWCWRNIVYCREACWSGKYREEDFNG